VILSGWKSIAEYLGCGVRTAQRWERNGLPVNRPTPGFRAHVVAHSEGIDRWIQRRASRAQGEIASRLTISLEKAQKLTREFQLAREELHRKMAALKKELAEIRAKRRHRLRDKHSAAIPKD